MCYDNTRMSYTYYINCASERISSSLLLYRAGFARVLCYGFHIILYYGFTTTGRYVYEICAGIKEYHIASYHIIIWTRPVDSNATCYDGAPPIVKQMVFIYRRNPRCNILRPGIIYIIYIIYVCTSLYCIHFPLWGPAV